MKHLLFIHTSKIIGLDPKNAQFPKNQWLSLEQDLLQLKQFTAKNQKGNFTNTTYKQTGI